MVLAAKIFVVREETDLETLAMKLKDYRVEETYEQEEHKIPLLTEVKDLMLRTNSLEGVFARDQVIVLPHHDKMVSVPKTLEAPFIFTKYGDRIFLTVMEKKARANNIANDLSKTLFIIAGRIVEARILPEVIKKFHEDNFEDTKVIFFDDVDIPNIEKLSLYGSALGDTSLYNDYLNHGKIWYTVVKTRKYGYVVGVTRDSVVTVFSRIEPSDLMTYLTSEIFPLIE
ncbi:MAG: hypothetical protein HYY22_05610 [Thaumarchaeota archaeon]|nr:hypothetical protein [Nitrososphaerota archaeon]